MKTTTALILLLLAAPTVDDRVVYRAVWQPVQAPPACVVPPVAHPSTIEA